jgi:hypothetical protein
VALVCLTNAGRFLRLKSVFRHPQTHAHDVAGHDLLRITNGGYTLFLSSQSWAIARLFSFL